MNENCVKFYTVVMIQLMLNGLNPSLLNKWPGAAEQLGLCFFVRCFVDLKKIKLASTEFFFVLTTH